MPTTATDNTTSSFGVQIYYSADGTIPTIATAAVAANVVGEILSGKLGGIDIKEISATHLNQGDAIIRSKPGAVDPGTLEVKINYNGPDVSALRLDATGRKMKWWLVQIPVSDTDPSKLDSFQFRGWIKSLSAADLPAEGEAITSDLTVRITGNITYTAAV